MRHLVLYDGVCRLCDRLVRFLLRRDRRDRLRFAPLQGPLATAALRAHGRDAADLDTVHVIADFGGPGERLRSGARAVLFAAGSLGGAWALARLLEPLPSRWLDAGYRFVAARRYRWFGRSERCAVPPPEDRAKFPERAEEETG